MPRVLWYAIYRTDGGTLRRIEVADAFGTAIRVNFVACNTLRYGMVRADRLAHITVDTFISDHQGHGQSAQAFLERLQHLGVNKGAHITAQCCNLPYQAG